MDAETLKAWSHHLAQRHLAQLGQLTTSSPPAAELPTVLHLADQVPSAQLPLEVLLDLAVVCPPWPQNDDSAGADPVRGLFERRSAATSTEAGDDHAGSLASLAEVLLLLADSPTRLVLVFALLRMGGDEAVGALLAVELSLVRRLLVDLARTYALGTSTLSIRLVCLHTLSLLLGAATASVGLRSTPLPPLEAVLPTLPPPSDELPRPFASLWSDAETLYGLSGQVIDVPGWGDVAMQLLQLEGDRKEWEDEALRLEQTEIVYSATQPQMPPASRPKPTDPAVLASIEQIQAILPDLSAAFIAGATVHPYFTAPLPAGAPATTVEERIIEAIFDSAPLPDDLNDLLSKPISTVEEEQVAAVAGPSSSVDAAVEAEFLTLARARREQAEQATGGAVDTSQVYRKDTSQVVPQISEAVPQSVRESIMRLVEVQREEQEEEEREERERQASRRAAAAAGKIDEAVAADDLDEDDDEPASARTRGTAMIGADGEASGDDEDTDAIPAAPSAPVSLDADSLLEDLYMSNKKVFDRDSATRRGKDRAALKEKTGLSDEQLEGWRIMLERNPRRMASIQARLGMFTPSASANSANSAKPPSATNGGSHPNGSNGGGRGRGSGGRGGRGGRGENKGSRGHQNAARKRGADRKAAMQGPKA